MYSSNTTTIRSGDVLDSERSTALDTAPSPAPPPPNAVDVDPEFVRQGLKDLMQQVNRIERQRVRDSSLFLLLNHGGQVIEISNEVLID